MKQRQPKQFHIDSLLILLLFGVFAACILFVLLTGAGVYRRLTERDQASYANRTGAQYIATKVRQAPGTVSLSSFEEGEALVLIEELDGDFYATHIYCWDGWLRELFTLAEEPFDPQAGEKVLEAQALELTLEDGLLSVRMTAGNGQELLLDLSIRGGGEAVS